VRTRSLSPVPERHRSDLTSSVEADGRVLSEGDVDLRNEEEGYSSDSDLDDSALRSVDAFSSVKSDLVWQYETEAA